MARILIHSLLFTPDAVSIAYLLRDLGRELLARGHEVHVLTTTPHYTVLDEEFARQPLKPRWGGVFFESEIDGIRVIHVRVPLKGASIGSRLRGAVRFQLWALAWAVAKERRYDVVLAPTQPLTMGVASWMLARWWRGVSIANVQDIFPDNLIRAGRIHRPSTIRWLQRLERFVYRRNDAVTVIADAFAETIRPRMADPARLHVIPNFVDTELYRPLPRDNAFARAHGLVGRFVLSYAGNIGHGQDMEPLLAAAAACRDLPLTVVIVGDGIRRPWLEKEVQSRRLDNVVLMPYQLRESMPLLNAASDMGTVLLDVHIREAGFPSKFFTVLACGRPVLVSADPASELAHAVRLSGAGRFAPAGQLDLFVAEVRRAWSERASLPTEGMKGRAWVERLYTREVVGRQYHELIGKLLAGRRPS